ncbi:hypothetical protein QJS04_geneDACA023288 [Acorus gramineus]|uniref:Uncharacterized protein n=1 Tax=Acorus gramineus TaxID=55184 RepID=A0AAV9BPY0_ACOGR|nr:hypothetical protein QJS04_geneDACA023288 [Acorus gramineus]
MHKLTTKFIPISRFLHQSPSRQFTEAEATDLRSALTETTRCGGESTANKIGNGVVKPSIAILSNPSHDFLARETAHHHHHPLLSSELASAHITPSDVDCIENTVDLHHTIIGLRGQAQPQQGTEVDVLGAVKLGAAMP